MSESRTAPGLDQANRLVQAFGERLGVSDARLDADYDRSFGEVGFRYDPGRRILTGRVFVGKIKIKTASEQGRANIATNLRALNDPAIGGLFERGGGRFVLDEDREILFLVKDFPLDSAKSAEVRRDMEDLMDLAAVWTLRWFRRVVRIAHGHEPAPSAPVTRANDPG